MKAPTAARLLNDKEWAILESVYKGTLPSRYRILITDGLGGGDRPFTIPTSALSALTLPAAAQAAYAGFVASKLGGLGDFMAKASNVTGFSGALALPSQFAGMVNLGYIVSVGPKYYADMSRDYPNPTAVHWYRKLLVHELAHVWQGKNSKSSMTFVTNSILSQCKAVGDGDGHGGAYDFTPGGRWSTYNIEQQAEIIEKWYVEGMKESGDLWPYIRDYVRKGIV